MAKKSRRPAVTVAPVTEAVAPVTEAVAPVTEAVAPVTEAVAPVTEAVTVGNMPAVRVAEGLANGLLAEADTAALFEALARFAAERKALSGTPKDYAGETLTGFIAGLLPNLLALLPTEKVQAVEKACAASQRYRTTGFAGWVRQGIVNAGATKGIAALFHPTSTAHANALKTKASADEKARVLALPPAEKAKALADAKKEAVAKKEAEKKEAEADRARAIEATKKQAVANNQEMEKRLAASRLQARAAADGLTKGFDAVRTAGEAVAEAARVAGRAAVLASQAVAPAGLAGQALTAAKAGLVEAEKKHGKASPEVQAAKEGVRMAEALAKKEAQALRDRKSEAYAAEKGLDAARFAHTEALDALRAAVEKQAFLALRAADAAEEAEAERALGEEAVAMAEAGE